MEMTRIRMFSSVDCWWHWWLCKEPVV